MSPPTPVLEVCCGSADFALSAIAAGAHRVELCDNLVEGGTTPSRGAAEITVERAGVPVMAMIRPRGGDFLYSDIEFEVMLRDIQAMKDVGAAGVVFGILLADGRVDRERTARLVDVARPLSVTFHRAFDVSRDLEESLEALMGLDVDRVLTSVGRPAVVDDLPLLTRLAEVAAGRVALMPAGGIRPSNVDAVIAVPGVNEVHIGATRTVESAMLHRVPNVPMGRPYHPDEYALEQPDTDVIVRVAAALSGGVT